MGSLVLNSDSFKTLYNSLDEFIEDIGHFLLLVVRISRRENIIYKDLLIDDLEIKRMINLAFSKISNDSSVFVNYQDCDLEFDGVKYNEDTALCLACINELQLLSMDFFQKYQEYQLELKIDDKSVYICNVFDWNSYNTIKVILEEQTIYQYFENHDLCVVSEFTDVTAFQGLTLKQRLIIVDKLFKEVKELVTPQHNLPYDRVKPLNDIIDSGKEYRLRLSNNTAYRLYYFVSNGKIAVLLDNIKKDEEITSQIKTRITNIHSKF
jgi:mRNA-degrading endonuclease RelE of RelBE toxin-antitoxin system